MPGFVMSPELKRAVQDMLRTYGNSFQPRPKRGRRLRRGGGGGGSTSNVTSFAVVIDTAGGSAHSSAGISFGTVGTCILLDESGAKSSVDSADEIEFKSAHRVDIITDTIIQLSAPDEIIPGSVWGDNPVIGQFVDSVDELFQLDGFAAQTSLSVPEAGTDAEDIQWLGGECEE